MLIHLKRLRPEARLPTQAEGDVGFDLYACDVGVISPGRVARVDIGIAIADYDPSVRLHYHHPGRIPAPNSPVRGPKLTVYPKVEGRSSLGLRGIFPIAGIIDPTFRGAVCVTLANMSADDYPIEVGDRVAQLVFHTCLALPDLSFEEADEVVPTRRGVQGFGSTGR